MSAGLVFHKICAYPLPPTESDLCQPFQPAGDRNVDERPASVEKPMHGQATVAHSPTAIISGVSRRSIWADSGDRLEGALLGVARESGL